MKISVQSQLSEICSSVLCQWKLQVMRMWPGMWDDLDGFSGPSVHPLGDFRQLQQSPWLLPTPVLTLKGQVSSESVSALQSHGEASRGLTSFIPSMVPESITGSGRLKEP